MRQVERRRGLFSSLGVGVVYPFFGAAWLLLAWTVAGLFRHPQASLLAFVFLTLAFLGLSTIVVFLLDRGHARAAEARERARAHQFDQVLKFRIMTEQARELSALLTPDGRFVYVSPSYRTVLGLDPEDLLQERFSDLLHPDDLARIGSWRPSRLTHYRLRDAGGGWRWMEGYCYEVRWQERLYVVGVARDVTELRRAQRAVIEYANQMRTLSRRLLAVQEEERRHIARELHDEVGQTLTASKIVLNRLRRGLGPDAQADAQDLELELDRVLEIARTLSRELRPAILDDFGLQAALRRLAGRTSEDGRGGLVLICDPDPLPRASSEIETVAYRVAQEALTNARRHAGAAAVRVRVRVRNGELVLRVEDDGRGFDVEAARTRAFAGESFGVLGMEERVRFLGGRFLLTSRPGAGTVVEARLPVGAAMGSSGPGA
jgi:PAS domain S-box-containing protein